MKTLVLVFHPQIERSTVNQRLAAAAIQLPNVSVRHLYAEYPDFQIDVAHEQQLLEQADRIVLQFPFYWYSSPALLKEYLDQVLTYDWAYGNNGTALAGKELLVAVSAGAHEEGFHHDGKVHYTVTDLLRPFQATSNYTQMIYLNPFIIYGTINLTEEALQQQVNDYLALLQDEQLVPLALYA